MEELNKTQIILLAIFITFVTSVATGVVVVTLMDQAPQGITQTVNRVVERTVERVISPGTVEKTEVKQIVREDDTIVSSVKIAKQSLVRVVRQSPMNEATSDGTGNDSQIASITESLDGTELALGRVAALDEVSRVGFVVSSDGLVVSSNQMLAGPGSVYYALLGEVKYSLKLLKSDDAAGIALFSMESVPKGLVSFKSLSADQISLGQTVITLGFESNLNSLAMGYVSGLQVGNASTTPVIKTNIKPTENWSGRPIMDINGFLIGMYGADNDIVPYASIKSLIDASLSKVSIDTATPASTVQ